MPPVININWTQFPDDVMEIAVKRRVPAARDYSEYSTTEIHRRPKPITLTLTSEQASVLAEIFRACQTISTSTSHV